MGGQPLGQHHALLVAAGEGLHRRGKARDLDGEPLHPVLAEGTAVGAGHEAEAVREAVHHREDDVVLDRLRQDDPERQPVLRDIGDAGVDRVAVGGELQGLALQQDRARLGPVHPEERQREFGAPGPEQADDAEHLAAAEGEAHVGEFAAAAEARHLQQRRGGRHVARDDVMVDVEAGHQLGDALLVHLAHRPGPDLPPVADDRHPLGDLHHLVEPVRDEDDGDAIGLQPCHDRQKAVHLGAGQRGGGLVHEDEPRLGGEAAGDGGDLALGDREVREGGVEIEFEIEALQDRRRDGPHPAPAHQPQRRAERIRDGDVLGHGQVREQRQVLEDHLDPERLGLGGIERQHRRPVDLDVAGGRRVHACHGLDQGRLAATVLPHEAMHLARAHVPVHLRKRLHAAEPLRHGTQAQERRRLCALRHHLASPSGKIRRRRTRADAAPPPSARARARPADRCSPCRAPRASGPG